MCMCVCVMGGVAIIRMMMAPNLLVGADLVKQSRVCRDTSGWISVRWLRLKINITKQFTSLIMTVNSDYGNVCVYIQREREPTGSALLLDSDNLWLHYRLKQLYSGLACGPRSWISRWMHCCDARRPWLKIWHINWRLPSRCHYLLWRISFWLDGEHVVNVHVVGIIMQFWWITTGTAGGAVMQQRCMQTCEDSKFNISEWACLERWSGLL